MSYAGYASDDPSLCDKRLLLELVMITKLDWDTMWTQYNTSEHGSHNDPGPESMHNP